MKEYKVKEGTYIPDTGIVYPEDPTQRLVKVKVEDSAEGRFRFDNTYKYLDRSLKHRFNQWLGAFIMAVPVALFNRLVLGLRYEGRSRIRRQYRKELKNGAVTVSNHVFIFDAVMAINASGKLRKTKIPMFAKHFNNGSFYWFLKTLGGIPVPEDRSGYRGFTEAFDEAHRRGEWIHVFPEALRWDYYKFIRPFHTGAFNMAYKYDIPVIPCVITYRERKGFFLLTGPKSKPLFTFKMLDPIFPDKSANKVEEVRRLTLEAHRKMEEAAGIIENPWPPIA